MTARLPTYPDFLEHAFKEKAMQIGTSDSNDI